MSKKNFEEVYFFSNEKDQNEFFDLSVNRQDPAAIERLENMFKEGRVHRVIKQKNLINLSIDKGYGLVPMDFIDDEARQIAVRWVENYELSGFDIEGKHKLASDFMNYARNKINEFIVKVTGTPIQQHTWVRRVIPEDPEAGNVEDDIDAAKRKLWMDGFNFAVRRMNDEK